MAGKDGGLRQLFRDHLAGTKFHIQTVEMAPGVSPGAPDFNYAAPGGIEGWVELKMTPHWKPSFKGREAQIAWLRVRSEMGCRAWIAVRRAPAKEDELWLVPGFVVSELNREGLRCPAVEAATVGCWPGGHRRWDWETIRTILTGPAPVMTVPHLV